MAAEVSDRWPVIALAAFFGAGLVALALVIGLGIAGRLVWFAVLDWWQYP